MIDHGFGHLEVIAFDAAEPPYKISVKEDISQALKVWEVFGEKPVMEFLQKEQFKTCLDAYCFNWFC